VLQMRRNSVRDAGTRRWNMYSRKGNYLESHADSVLFSG